MSSATQQVGDISTESDMIIIKKKAVIGKQCLGCGDKFEVYPSRSDAQFCSRECYLETDHNPNEEKKVTIDCDYCGSVSERIPSVAERGEHTFCNYDCRDAWQEENLTGEDNPRWEGGGNELTCDQCDEEYVTYHDPDVSRFCCKECYAEWLSQNWVDEDHPLWDGGYTSEFGSDWLTQRRKALERDKVCQLCGANEDLHVHHIIRRREFVEQDIAVEEANRLGNLLTLCNSCHQSVEWLGKAVGSDTEEPEHHHGTGTVVGDGEG